MKKFRLFNWLFLIAAFLMVFNASAQEKVYNYGNNWGNEGLTIEKQNNQSISFNFSITKFSTITSDIKGESLQNISLTGCFLPNDAGYPDLPGNGKYIAIPQGSTPKLKVISYNVESIKNIDIAPAFVIPADIDNRPLIYERNMEVYSKNEFYPANPVTMSEKGNIRGVDVVMLGITPFQYNPVTKELLVYRDIKIEITFEGGNGHFGDDAFRSRWFDPILEDALFNYSSLPVIDYDKRMLDWINSDATGCEYLIIVPNNAEFSTWADSIKKFRTEQGVITKIVKLQDITGGTSYNEIKTYITDGYTNWEIKPAACLLMGDYGQDPATTIDAILYPDPGFGNFPCDNYYGDVNYDEMPEIVMARMTVNNEAQLQVQCTKVLNYERNPPTAADFYDHPITALGWQTERWFQLCSEIVGGYFRTLGKHPVRINAIYSGTPGSIWSTATNTATITSCFGPSGLNYIPATPGELGGWSGGNSTMVNNAINAGAFMLQHRDHGEFTAWGEPYYTVYSIPQLTNVDNKLPFVFSINCQTGGFHYGGGYGCLAEAFHRYTYNSINSGALGAIGAAEVSYSFVNDTYAWGMYDNMWPDFMPAYGTTPASRGILPAFGNAAGKYFLQQSSWPYNTGNKQITYRLLTMFGDAFMIMYSEVPQSLTVTHPNCVNSGDPTFSVTAPNGSFIALSLNGEVLGTATGTGSPVAITLPAALTAGKMIVTVTKTNSLRYSSEVTVVMNGPNAAFTFAMADKTFYFTNTSSNATSYEWDFGDGTPVVTETNPVHTYAVYGTYTVKLKANGVCGFDEQTEILNAIQGINENSFVSSNFFIIPNPNNGVFNVTTTSNSKETYNIKVLNALNVAVYENSNLTANGKLLQTVDLSKYPSGVYYLIIESNGNRILKKFSIQK